MKRPKEATTDGCACGRPTYKIKQGYRVCAVCDEIETRNKRLEEQADRRQARQVAEEVA